MNQNSKQILAGLGELLAAAIWGFAFVVVKDSLNYVSPNYLIAIRFSLAAIALFFICIKRIKTITKRQLIFGGLAGFFLSLANIFQTIGLDYTTAGKNAFFTTIYIILVPLFLWILTKKRPNFIVFVCAVIAIVGIAFLALGSSDTGKLNLGDVLTLICGAFYALNIIVNEKICKESNPLVLSMIQFATTGILGWIIAPIFDGTLLMENLMQSKVIISLLYLGLGSSLISYTLQNIGLKYVPSSISVLLLSFESVFGTLFGILMLNEPLTFKMILGCALMFVAVILSQRN